MILGQRNLNRRAGLGNKYRRPGLHVLLGIQSKLGNRKTIWPVTSGQVNLQPVVLLQSVPLQRKSQPVGSALHNLSHHTNRYATMTNDLRIRNARLTAILQMKRRPWTGKNRLDLRFALNLVVATQAPVQQATVISSHGSYVQRGLLATLNLQGRHAQSCKGTQQIRSCQILHRHRIASRINTLWPRQVALLATYIGALAAIA